MAIYVTLWPDLASFADFASSSEIALKQAKSPQNLGFTGFNSLVGRV